MKNEDSKETLGDWGEFRLINEVVLPTLIDAGPRVPLGDDCAYIPIPHQSNSLVITTDTAPKPLAWQLGHQSFWTWGWYAVVISLSDLAAAGAVPIAFTSSVEAPPAMTVSDFRDFFAGMAAACKELAVSNAGGNIQSAPRFECHCTAIGALTSGAPVTRAGCRPGDSIVIIGESGRFISAYLSARANGLSTLSETELAYLLRPKPQLRAMNKLLDSGVLSAASDNSDGLLGALWNIAERSACGIELNLNENLIDSEIRGVAEKEKVDPWNLMFFWGDWQVAVAITATEWKKFEEVAKKEDIKFTLLGRAVKGVPMLYGKYKGQRTVLNVLRNEHFTSSAYSINIEDQLQYMLNTSIFAG